MFTSQLGNTIDGTALKLCGRLTVGNSEELRTLFTAQCEGTGQLSLDFSEVGEIDVAGLQLLCSAHKTWSLAGRRVTCAGGTPEALRQAAKETGFIRENGCTLLSDGSCLFTGGPHE